MGNEFLDVFVPALGYGPHGVHGRLAVRIVNRRTSVGRSRTAVVLVVVLVAYPLSIYPLEWLWGRGMLPNLRWVDQARAIYRSPIVWVADNGPEWFEYALDWVETTAVTRRRLIPAHPAATSAPGGVVRRGNRNDPLQTPYPIMWIEGTSECGP